MRMRPFFPVLDRLELCQPENIVEIDGMIRMDASGLS